MFVLGNMIGALAVIVDVGLRFYWMCLLAAVVISWVAPRSRHPAITFVRGITEPLLYRIRKALPFTYQSGLDFSPIIAILAIEFLRRFLVSTLLQAAGRLR